VAKLIEVGVDIDYKNPTGVCRLSLLASRNHFALIQGFHPHRADLLYLDIDRLHRMDHAAIQGYQEVEHWLFRAIRKLVDIENPVGSFIIKRHLRRMLICATERGGEGGIHSLLTKRELMSIMYLSGKLYPH
jgi:hypothetical protein